MPGIEFRGISCSTKSKNQMHEMLAGIPRAGAENPQRVPDECQHCNRLITFDTSSEDRNIRRALMSAKEVRMALEARPKNESVAQGSIGDRSRFYLVSTEERLAMNYPFALCFIIFQSQKAD